MSGQWGRHRGTACQRRSSGVAKSTEHWAVPNLVSWDKGSGEGKWLNCTLPPQTEVGENLTWGPSWPLQKSLKVSLNLYLPTLISKCCKNPWQFMLANRTLVWFGFWDSISLSSLCWPQTQDPPVSVSWVLDFNWTQGVINNNNNGGDRAGRETKRGH